MAFFRRTRTQMPREMLRVNMGHPLAKDIAFFYYHPIPATPGSGGLNPSNFYDGVTNRISQTAELSDGTGSLVSGPTGGYSSAAPTSMPYTLFPQERNGTVYVHFNTHRFSQQDTVTFINPHGILASKCTVISACRCVNKITTRVAGAAGYGVISNVVGPLVGFDQNGHAMGGFYEDSNYTTHLAVDAVDHSLSQEWVVLGAAVGNAGIGNAGNNLLWVNGIRYVGTAPSLARDTAAQDTWVGWGTGNNSDQNDVAWSMGFNRVLTDAEHQAIAQNPWQILSKSPTYYLMDFTIPWKLVNHVASQGFSGSTSGAIDTTGADLIVVAQSYLDPTAPTLSDNKGNVYTPLNTYSENSTNDIQFYYCQSPKVGTGHTFTTSGGQDGAFCVQAWSGSAQSPFALFDVQNGAGGPSGSQQPGSITPSGNKRLVISAQSVFGSDPSSVDSGFTITDHFPTTGGQWFGMGMAYLIQDVASAVNPTWSGGTFPATNIASFNPASPIIIRQMSSLGVG